MEDKNQQEGIMQTHTSLVSFLILMPFGIFQSSMNSNEPEPTQGVDLFSFHIVWIAILCGVNWYVEMNLAARTIRRVGPLAFSIIDVVRRLVVISSAVVMFGNPISGRNIAGVVIAMCGAVAYNVSRNQPSIKAEKKSENSKTRRESQAQNSGWMKKLENKKSAK
jgi:solute carrier family 35 protein E1